MRILSGWGIGRVYKLDKPTITVGRAADAEIRLDDDSISRRHASITVSQDGAILEDLRSKNGTYVNGDSIVSRPLRDGDMVQFGSHALLKFTWQHEIERQLQQSLYDAAVRDMLTGTYNRRFFEDELSRALTHALRHGQSLALLLIDIDHFKGVNDSWGHVAGDQVLVQLARRAAGVIRHEDVLCRIGGEEFGIVARSTSAANAVVLAERLRTKIRETPFSYEREALNVTVSIGTASSDQAIEKSTEGLFKAADRLLYAAKRAGRDRVNAEL